MCNLYSITTNQAAIIALFRVINRYVGNLAPLPGVFPDYPAPVIRDAGKGRELVMMRWASLLRGRRYEFLAGNQSAFTARHQVHDVDTGLLNHVVPDLFKVVVRVAYHFGRA
jgi:hypothetical protein